MNKLIRNELAKVFHKKSIYVMLIIMLVFTVIGTISLKSPFSIVILTGHNESVITSKINAVNDI